MEPLKKVSRLLPFCRAYLWHFISRYWHFCPGVGTERQDSSGRCGRICGPIRRFEDRCFLDNLRLLPGERLQKTSRVFVE